MKTNNKDLFLEKRLEKYDKRLEVGEILSKRLIKKSIKKLAPRNVIYYA